MDSRISPVKQFLLDRFLPGEDPRNLTPATPLISGGILDSLGTLELVAFLEEHFGVELEAQDVDPARLDTLERIATLIGEKQGSRA